MKENCLLSKMKANESGWSIIFSTYPSEIAEEQIGDTGFPESIQITLPFADSYPTTGN